jgi:hypothetical protein
MAMDGKKVSMAVICWAYRTETWRFEMTTEGESPSVFIKT